MFFFHHSKKENTQPHGPQIAALNAQGERPQQQDSWAVSDWHDETLCRERGILLTMADGMGGLDHGDEVSALLVEELQKAFREREVDAAPDAWLLELLGQANRSVNRLLRDRTPGGSTLVMALVLGNELFHLSVGDSRLYLSRGRGLVLLNREQSYGVKLDLMLVKGILPPSELASHPQRRALTSYVGMGDLEGVDRNTVPLKLQEGDKLLLLSDGVFSTLTEEEICQCLTDDPGQSARTLAERVREHQKPHQDNYTAVIYAHGS
jgi:serine/threonine protein phosphatase PrpC